VATVVAVVTALFVFVVACFASWQLHFWFPWLIMVMVQIPAAWGWSVLHHWVQGQLERQFLEQSLSMYLSPKLVKKFSRDKDLSLLQPGAEKQKLTILFSDIASFTSISEGMDSDELAKMMNEYFEGAVGTCIHPTDGTVVKYIGDAIFAFWNAPEPQNDHAVRACQAALQFRDLSGREVRGRKLITRIGLHTGVANVGNFGSATRVDYTAIGEDVNMAARMEGLNKYLGTTVLMTGAVKAEIGDRFATRHLGRFQLKGFERAVEVHELLGTPGGNGSVSADRFAEGLKAFRARDLEGAAKTFERMLETHPHDGPAKFYAKHIEEIRGETATDGWSGEIELKEK
jgi:adenylate cyclase